MNHSAADDDDDDDDEHTDFYKEYNWF